LAISLLVLISAVTGILLGWKKQSDWLQPGTERGVDGTLDEWQSLDRLANTATIAFTEAVGAEANSTIDRMDVRPGKNSVKVRFEHEDYEVQVDGISGAVLHVGQRNADWIERIHDGSIISEYFKLVSMNMVGFGLLIMTLTGLWLYYGPKRYRAYRRQAK